MVLARASVMGPVQVLSPPRLSSAAELVLLRNKLSPLMVMPLIKARLAPPVT